MKFKEVRITILLGACFTALLSNCGSKSDSGAGGETGGVVGTAGGEPGSAAIAGGTGGTIANAGGSGGFSPTGSGGAAASTGGSGGASSVNTATCVPPKLTLTRVVPAGKLEGEPVVLTQPPGDPRLYIVERIGRIVAFKDGNITTFLNMLSSIPDLTPNGSGSRNERGILGFTFHPKDPNRFFIMYARSATDPLALTGASDKPVLGDIVIAQGKRSAANPDVAEKGLTLLTKFTHAARYHNGGFFAFGADGLLYAGVGEGGLDGMASWAGEELRQRAGNSQDPKSRIGKVLRIDVEKPTQMVPGNVVGGDPLVWGIGMRNPWRGSFDRATGDMYIGDVGEGSWEEVNYIARDKLGTNPDFGWGQLEGKRCFPWFFPLDCTTQPATGKTNSGKIIANPGICNYAAVSKGRIEPVVVYGHDGPSLKTDPDSIVCGGTGKYCDGISAECSRAVIGGYVYRGSKIKDIYGRYFYGDHVRNTISSFIVKDGQATCEAAIPVPNNTVSVLSSFGEDAAGELYTVDLNGGVFRLDPAP